MTESPAAAFFTRKGSTFTPAPHAGSPWDRNILHGRLIAGVAAQMIERDHGDPAFQFSRLTVDLFRPPPLAPIDVETRMTRDGNRIRVVEASVQNDGVEMARTSAVMLRRTEQPTGTVWSPPEWSVPHPDDIEPPQPRGGAGASRRPQGWVPPWETRPITRGGFGTVAQKRTWLRENRDLVEGEALTPFIRAANAADYANPLANSGDQGLEFINADITLYLHRLPEGDWIGFEVSSHRSAEGVAVGACTLYDTQGAIGHSLICGVANQRRDRR